MLTERRWACKFKDGILQMRKTWLCLEWNIQFKFENDFSLADGMQKLAPCGNAFIPGKRTNCYCWLLPSGVAAENWFACLLDTSPLHLLRLGGRHHDCAEEAPPWGCIIGVPPTEVNQTTSKWQELTLTFTTKKVVQVRALKFILSFHMSHSGVWTSLC